MTSVLDVPLVDAMTYEEYRALIDRLLAEGKTTSGEPTANQLEDTKLNVRRMNRLDQTIELTGKLTRALGALKQAQTWLVLSEGWCGDAAQTVPMIAKAAAASACVTMRVILREKNPSVMDRFLTDGTRSIPIVIMLEPGSNRVLGVWGPRPVPALALVAEYKSIPGWSKEAMLTALHTWYAKDKTLSAQHELAALVRAVSA
ncbi:MAG TPA: thioredoxin family protein [Bacteroidota bacterium]|nr:thioredoxin family protein [Bacteroidota bacterium]